MQEPVHLSLVLPVYHCAGRLERTLDELAKFLDGAPHASEVVLVDDRGRHPHATALLRQFAARPDVRLLENDRNRGKGYSVRRGMLAARGRHRVFTDSDLAYPLREVRRITDALEQGADVAIACRVHPDSAYELHSDYLHYFYTRHAMSRAFNRLVRFALLPGVLDTQAGLKGFTADAARAIFPQVRIAGFGFDLECLYLARRLALRVEQVPVSFRYDDEPSTVRFLRDAGTMIADLARIRLRGLTAAYDRAPQSRTSAPSALSAPSAPSASSATVHGITFQAESAGALPE